MKRLVLAVMFVLTAFLLTSPVLSAQTLVLSLTDPLGDDRGLGTYTYPKADVFKPGVFDITKFEIYLTEDKVIFKVFVKDLGGNPWNGPNGFSMQYIQIYVHTTLKNVFMRMDTIGLNVVIRSDYGWHFALLLAPGWGEVPVPKGERAALYYANGTVIAQNDILKVYAVPEENAVVAEVSKAALPDVDNIAMWKVLVFLTSYDGFGPMKVRPVGVEAEEWVVGGGRELAKAILAGIEPRVMDLLAPTAEEQYEWLSGFDVERKLLAMVPGID
ncbi:MAG: hypothetical protein DRJ41_00535 [Thermoprotei archaeon]|nr:MAG: hypothetical protein DRJ41_00535 [Thermoprotei archaeon]